MQEGRQLRVPARVQPEKDARVQFLCQEWILSERWYVASTQCFEQSTNDIEEECLYLHIDPSKKLPPCPHYEKGFCPLGPNCSKKHIRKTLCEFYLAGFCPDGKTCKKAHPRWPIDLPKPTVRVERDPEEVAEEQRILRENAEREEMLEREKYNASGEGGGRGGGRGRWHGGRGRGGGGYNRRGRGYNG